MVKRATQRRPLKPIEDKPKRDRISGEAIAWSQRDPKATRVTPFAVAQHPPGVSDGAPSIAQDEAFSAGALEWAAGFGMVGVEGLAFLGYPILAEMTQRPENRRIVETIATEMTRKWIKIQATGDDDKTDKIAKINNALKRFGVQRTFCRAAEHDGYFGRGHIYIDLGDGDDRDELQTPIGDGRSKVSKAKVGRNSIKAIRALEPMWIYPTQYNSSDPLSQEWYNPMIWLVNGKPVHRDRLLLFVGREVPDILKPAYSFGGLPLTQMAKPSVDNWLRARQSVSDIMKSFSVFVLKTNLVDKLASGNEGGEDVYRRVQMFNNYRDNGGTFLLDMTLEDFTNVSAPLGTLDALQAQALEHICSVVGIPLVKYTGITPSGLNASSDGEIRSFYDWIASYQESLFRPNLTRIIDFIQLSEFGEVDPDIVFSFEHLWSLDDEKKAAVRKMDADTAVELIDAGVIAPLEERKRIAADPNTPYVSLDVEDLPEPPSEQDLQSEHVEHRDTEQAGDIASP